MPPEERSKLDSSGIFEFEEMKACKIISEDDCTDTCSESIIFDRDLSMQHLLDLKIIDWLWTDLHDNQTEIERCILLPY